MDPVRNHCGCRCVARGLEKWGLDCNMPKDTGRGREKMGGKMGGETIISDVSTIMIRDSLGLQQEM